jgi:hypothetical protein
MRERPGAAVAAVVAAAAAAALLAVLVGAGVARGGESLVAVSLPAGGAVVAPNAPVVLEASDSVDRLTVTARVGKKVVAADLERWLQLGGERAGSYYLLRPKAPWAAGAAIGLTVSVYPGKLSAKVGAERDTAPPVAGAIGTPRLLKGKTRFGTEEEHLLVEFGPMKDAAPIVCLRLRMVDAAAAAAGRDPRASEPEGATPSGVASLFYLASATPTCVAAGAVVDPSGNLTALPGAACAKGLPAALTKPVEKPCARPTYVDHDFDGVDL